MPNSATVRVSLSNDFPATAVKSAASHTAGPLNMVLAGLDSIVVDITATTAFKRQATTDLVLVGATVQRHPQTGLGVSFNKVAGVAVIVTKVDPAATGGVTVVGNNVAAVSIDDMQPMADGILLSMRKEPWTNSSIAGLDETAFTVTVPSGFKAQVMLLTQPAA